MKNVLVIFTHHFASPIKESGVDNVSFAEIPRVGDTFQHANLRWRVTSVQIESPTFYAAATVKATEMFME